MSTPSSWAMALVLLGALGGPPGRSQEQPAAPPAAEASPAPPVQSIADSIDVVAATPADAWGVPRDQVPANVQSVGAAELRQGHSLASSLEKAVPSVQLQESQGSSWQPDVQLRGFSASSLLGVPQGLAVYQDGVRLNDSFGDTVRWDLVPTFAIARLDVLPGSNPLFGLNALGGALVLETKSGFSDPGLRGAVTAGSFGRRTVELEGGLARSSRAAFVAFGHTEENGWRDFSPSRLDQLFGRLSWAGPQGGASLSATAVSNRLSGNGPSPLVLIQEDRSAVFTHPDRTEPEALLLSGQASRMPSPRLEIETNAFFRRQRLRTFNGDAADFGAPAPGPADIQADAIENRTLTDQTSLGGSLQMVWHAGRSRTALGVTADAGRAAYSSSTELARLTPDRGTEGLGIDLPEDRIRVDSRTSTAALFGLETFRLDARTTLSLSARWQRSDERLRDRLGTALDGDHTFRMAAPSLGFTRALAERWTLFGNYGLSSRVPTPVELTCADVHDPCRLPNAFVSDPPLRQVVTRTAELGTRASRHGADLSAAVFRAESRDDILFISSGSLTGSGHFANIGRTRREGAELLARGRLAHEGTWFVTYSFLEATFQTAFSAPAPNHPDAQDGSLRVLAGDRLPLVPAHTAKAGFEVPLGRARLTASLLHVSARYLRGDEVNLLSPLGAYTRVDTSLSHPLGHGFRGFLEVENLLNEKYETFGLLGDPGAVLGPGQDPRFLSPGSPRTFIAGVRFGAGE